MNEVLQAITHRRSIRHYTDEPVDRATIVKLLKAGMAAPSASNRQPWEFIAITDRKTLNRIAEVHSNAEMLDHAPLCICVCGDLQAYDGVEGIWVQDCSAATENILLAAEALRLGAVWCGVHPGKSLAQAIRTILGMPAHIALLNVIAIGYPDENPSVKDKWREDKIHWQRR